MRSIGSTPYIAKHTNKVRKYWKTVTMWYIRHYSSATCYAARAGSDVKRGTPRKGQQRYAGPIMKELLSQHEWPSAPL